MTACPWSQLVYVFLHPRL